MATEVESQLVSTFCHIGAKKRGGGGPKLPDTETDHLHPKEKKMEVRCGTELHKKGKGEMGKAILFEGGRKTITLFPRLTPLVLLIFLKHH